MCDCYVWYSASGINFTMLQYNNHQPLSISNPFSLVCFCVSVTQWTLIVDHVHIIDSIDPLSSQPHTHSTRWHSTWSISIICYQYTHTHTPTDGDVHGFYWKQTSHRCALARRRSLVRHVRGDQMCPRCNRTTHKHTNTSHTTEPIARDRV